MNKLVCLDFGHGGYDSGAVGKNGTYEKNINMSVGFKTANYLKFAGINVCYTRDNDKVSWPSNLSQDLTKRMQIANNYNPDIFVSIHCNSFSANSKGFEIFTTPGQNNSDILATKIHSRVKYAFPNLVYREDISDGDVDKEANFYVIKYAKCPATLIEMLFISNPEEEKMLNDPEFQDKMAFAIAQGIGDYFGIKVEKEIDKKEINNDTMILNTKNTIKFTYNNTPKEIENYIINDTSYVKTRDIINLFSKILNYDEQNRTVDIKDNIVKIDVNGNIINGQLINNKSFCPVRDLAENLGKTVEWDVIDRKVIIK